MSMTIHSQEHDDTVVVSINGELDMATAPDLHEHLRTLLEPGGRHLVLDLTETSFCDSTGLSIFIYAKDRCEDAGTRIRLAAPQRGVQRILEVSGLVEVLPSSPTVTEAITQVRATA